ncbi:radical SAM protein [bacterium]
MIRGFMIKKYKTLFGPVPSRRFGRSLGVDLIPLKICSFDCIFCQLGRTTNKTMTRKAYVSSESVMDELNDWLISDGYADYITLSGSGEPTLHSDFGEILQNIHLSTKIPSVLLTNGSLFYLPKVRKAACYADVVKISLSAWDQIYFWHINRPHQELNFEKIIEGMKLFRKDFDGRLWIEVFLIGGMNSIPADVQRIAQLIQQIKPDQIHLNTAIRPPAEDFVNALSQHELSKLTSLFYPRARVIPDCGIASVHDFQVNENGILALLQRRPCTAEQIGIAFGMHLNETVKYLGDLLKSGKIEAVNRNQSKYYMAVHDKLIHSMHS